MSEEHDIHREHIGDAPHVARESLIALALLNAPAFAFLVAQTLRYALVGPACELGGARVLLELATLIALAGAAAIMTYGWRRAGRTLEGAYVHEEPQSRFLGTAGVLLAALFLLAGCALWLPSLFLSPCGRP